MKRRWWIGDYEVKINPKQSDSSMRATIQPIVMANGTVSSPNLFFEKEVNLTLDVVDQPTSIIRPYLKTFGNGYYTAITEDSFFNQFYLLRLGNAVDVTDANGVTIKSFPLAFTDPPIYDSATGIAYLSGEIAWYFPRQAGTSVIVITDENGNQLRKYSYNTTDMLDVLHICYNKGDGFIYTLNRYGIISRIDPTNGSATMLVQFADYNANRAADKSAYTGIHIYGNYIGILHSNMIEYYTLGGYYDLFHKIECPTGLTAITATDYSRTAHAITSSRFFALNLNLAVIDLEKLKVHLGVGFVTLRDENNTSKQVAITEMSVRRVRERAEVRYEVSINGTEL